MEFSHKPSLKQQNKKFKSKHATKSQEKIKAKSSLKQTQRSKLELSKVDRLNQAKVIQSQKRNAIQMSTRLFNGQSGTPKIIVSLLLLLFSFFNTFIYSFYYQSTTHFVHLLFINYLNKNVITTFLIIILFTYNVNLILGDCATLY